MELPDPFSLVGLTYDDVLLLPGRSDVIPSGVNTATQVTQPVLHVAHRRGPLRLGVRPARSSRGQSQVERKLALDRHRLKKSTT